MDQLKLFEDLLLETSKINYTNRELFELIEERAKMYVRKFFGDQSHYLNDLNSINYAPLIYFSDIAPDHNLYFEGGLKDFKKIITIIIEDLRLSTNYPALSSTGIATTISLDKGLSAIVNPEKRKALDGKTIHILIASPSDVTVERELLVNSLETKFRREGFESQCGKRIIIRGWEELASQSGYGQDIINKQVLKKVDIVLAVFKHKLGTPTIDPTTSVKREESGTAEELLFAINNSSTNNPPLGMAYFFSEAPNMSFDSIEFEKSVEEWKRLKKFKQDIRHKILYKEYSSSDKLLTQACSDISENIRQHFE
ncbi:MULTISPECIES: hypothetical protein [Niastella]|uniref:CD-NTase-associated protein 12/Pycsar effector protein TIR domain-containing protein n=1 Tax=Niastella soli TaxID=2821487 RepID=A0ABS3YVZ3_9BACT|nr:hypothetical protein [Niastella soli]MBO9202038.1 hypothetical protein [Niastella soli]